jgi:hypothetical protein
MPPGYARWIGRAGPCDFDVEAVRIELWTARRSVLQSGEGAVKRYEFGAEDVRSGLDVARDLDGVGVVIPHKYLVAPCSYRIL